MKAYVTEGGQSKAADVPGDIAEEASTKRYRTSVPTEISLATCAVLARQTNEARDLQLLL